MRRLLGIVAGGVILAACSAGTRAPAPPAADVRAADLEARAAALEEAAERYERLADELEAQADAARRRARTRR